MSPTIAPRTPYIDVDALKRERPLVDVLASSGVTVRREGAGTYRALCPFHQERTPSFWVDVRTSDNEHYFCFGCSATGDVITFVMERESCSFVEACERLASRGRPRAVPPGKREPQASRGRRWEELDPNSAESQVLQLATQAYEEQLWRDARARAYLEARGVPEHVARAQRLGYADGNALLQRLGPEDREVAQRVGLVLERPPEWTTGPRFREFLADRIIVPELRGGRPIWLIGRAIGEPSTVCGSGTPADTVPRRRGRPKYLSLPGERPVLGLEQVVGRKVVYVVEGPFDWLAAISWSLPAFAICGTHFPIERLPSLDSAVAVYGVFDPDRAGRSAAERLAPLIGSRWRPVHLPNGLDVAELALLGEQGRETFQVLVGRARALAWQDDRV